MTPPPAGDALRAVLLALPGHAPVDRLDRLWIFPPREVSGRESGLLVVALLPADEFPTDHRRILTVRYEAARARARAAPTLAVAEQGWAPADRLERVIAGVVARLGDDAEDPAEHAVAGDPTAWRLLLEHYGAAVVDRAYGE